MPFEMRSTSLGPIRTPRILAQRASTSATHKAWPSSPQTFFSIDSRQIKQLRFLSEMTYPFEACGLFVGRMDQQRIIVHEVLQARNLTEYAIRDRYVLDPEDFLLAEQCARDRGLKIVGIWHSHPNHPAEPSTRDLEAAWHGYSYVIVSVDALGDTVVRSWRLQGSRLVTEPIEVRLDD